MRTVHVLVADDSDAYRDAAAGVVRAVPGFEVVGAASSGEEAVRLSSDLRPDFVLMDARMDGTDGAEATRAILALRPETVVVLMSARPDALPAGADGCGAAAVLDKRDLSPPRFVELWQRHNHRGTTGGRRRRRS